MDNPQELQFHLFVKFSVFFGHNRLNQIHSFKGYMDLKAFYSFIGKKVNNPSCKIQFVADYITPFLQINKVSARILSSGSLEDVL